MPTRSAKIFSIVLLVSDFFILLIAFTLAYVLRVRFDERPLVNEVYAMDFLQTCLSIAPIWLLVFASLGLYTSTVYSRRLAEIGKLLIGTFIGILVVLGYAFVIDEPVFPARLVAVYAFVGSFLLLVFEREFLRQMRMLLFTFGKGISRVLVVGKSAATRDIIEQMSQTEKSGYNVVAIAGPKSIVPPTAHAQHYDDIEDALAALDVHKITTIIQTDMLSSGRNQQVLSVAQTKHINYSFIPGEGEFYSGKNTVDVFLGYPIISVHQTPLIGWGEVVKRIFDVFATLLAMPLLLPLFLLVCLLQKAFNPGPIFYISKRLTRYSKPFNLYKFRSMGAQYGQKDAADEFREMGREDLAREYELNRKVKNDPRITWFGKFIRITSLDEMPQLVINVLRGDLSLVGPRPILPQEMKFSEKRGALLHSVKSGVTGLWQVSGRSDLSFDKRIELELYYAQNWSFWMDIKILFKTIQVLFFGKGAR